MTFSFLECPLAYFSVVGGLVCCMWNMSSWEEFDINLSKYSSQSSLFPDLQKLATPS